MFHDKAQIFNSLNKKFVGDIEQYSQYVDFQAFLSVFKNEEEIRTVSDKKKLVVHCKNCTAALPPLFEKFWIYVLTIKSKF